jgi:hypothetical protein
VTTTPVSAKERLRSRWLRRPRYARDLIWSTDALETPLTTCSSLTEFKPPVPRPPLNELNNLIALRTIASRPDLFKIISPIRVDVFERYLLSHPNRAHVASVCLALREGFWPWAITDDPALPTTFDNSHRPITDPRHTDFLLQQCKEEMALGQFSPSFGKELLPAMYSSPIGVVPKPHSEKLRMVVDQSAEPFSPNSLIPKSERSVHMDGLHQLGRALRRARAEHPTCGLVLFKSDVSRAYRLIPMHPLWQLRQVATIAGEKHVNRCNHFGNGAGGRVYGCVGDLAGWIAVNVKDVDDLFIFVDDNFSWDFDFNLEYYQPYDRFMPGKQVKLLLLWDELGIPHEDKKQVWGSPLTIIGLDVDASLMSITMPPQSRIDLLAAVRSFAQLGQRRPLRDFQRIAGWINWSLNAYPLLRPALSAVYNKMSGKTQQHQPVWINQSIVNELSWFTRHVEASDGVLMLDSIEWSEEDADLTLYSDACGFGMGFWAPRLLTGFQCPIPPSNDPPRIFFDEALAVVSALDYACRLTTVPHRVAIFSDNTNTVDMFNSLHAKPSHNPLLLTAVDISSSSSCLFRVFHIPGELNIVADALSRFRNDVALRAAPGLTITTFQPPQLTLGAIKK